MKCNSLDGKNIDLGDIKVEYGDLAQVWGQLRDSLWSQIEDGVRKKAEADKEASKKYTSIIVKPEACESQEEFTANDAHKLAHESAQAKVNKGLLTECLYKIKEVASKGEFEVELSVDGTAFNFVRYELLRLGYTVSSGEINEFDNNVMNFTVSW